MSRSEYTGVTTYEVWELKEVDRECPWNEQQLGWLFSCKLLKGKTIGKKRLITMESYNELKAIYNTINSSKEN